MQLRGDTGFSAPGGDGITVGTRAGWKGLQGPWVDLRSPWTSLVPVREGPMHPTLTYGAGAQGRTCSSRGSEQWGTAGMV